MSGRYEPSCLRAERLDERRDRDAMTAPRPLPRPPIKRRLVAERVNFTAWDAHRLLEQESEAIQARPGHPLG